MATNLGTAFVTIMPSAKGIKGEIEKELGAEASSAGESAGRKLMSGLTGIIAGIGVAGVVSAFKQVIDAGADLQQSFGGLETIYGDASDSMKEMAYNAAQAGISANDYAEQAVSMGAALKQAVGNEQEAAELADLAIMDMADNAAKMGSDITSIQNAYQGFAKGNFTMLDNLKLGFGGTKEEMERLVAYADEIDAKNGIIHGERSVDNLDDIIGAIHTVQQELGLTGVAAQEGAETFSGSFAAMKAAAQNLFANLSLGEDIGPSLEALLESVGNFLVGNLLPMIGNVLKQIPGLLYDGLMSLFENLPGAIDTVIEWLNGLTAGIQDNSGIVSETFAALGHAAMEMFRNIDWKGLGIAVLELLGYGLMELGSSIWDLLKWIGETAWTKFKEVDWKAVGLAVLEEIAREFERAGEMIWNGLKKIGEAAWTKFKEIDWKAVGEAVLQEIAREFERLGHLIWGGLTALGEKAKEAFLDLPWVQMGADVINGIIEGLTSFGNAIWNVLSEMASEAWGGLLSFFGINSPSKLMRDTVGKPIALGIAAGIDAEADAVRGSLDAIAKDSATGFDVPLGVSGDLGGGSGTGINDNSSININIYASEGMNIRQLAERVSEELSLWEKQKQAAWA